MPEVAINALSPAQRRVAAKAREAAQRGDGEVAKSLCLQVLAEEPTCWGVRQLWFDAELAARSAKSGWLQRMRHGLGRWKKGPAAPVASTAGLVAADAMLRRDFTSPAGWETLCEAARQLELPRTELLAGETYAKVHPDDRGAAVSWAETLLRVGRPREALVVAQRLLEQNPADARVLALVRRVSVAVTMQSGRLGSEPE